MKLTKREREAVLRTLLCYTSSTCSLSARFYFFERHFEMFRMAFYREGYSKMILYLYKINARPNTDLLQSKRSKNRNSHDIAV